MKIFYIILFLYSFLSVAHAQPGTEIYIFDLIKDGNKYNLKNPVNISFSNPGYDNQPHFLNSNSVLYAATRAEQTDIAKVEFNGKSLEWLTQTQGSEYSPTPTPDGEGFSAILLEKDGTQLLWKYYFDERDPKVLVPDLKIGYHCWFDENTIVAFVLGEPLTLQICHLRENKNKVIAENIGRSLHKIPDQQRVSYISKETENWKIMALDPVTGEKNEIIHALPGSDDMAWDPDGVIFMGKENELYKFEPKNDQSWQKVTSLEDLGLYNITRLAISPNGKKIAIVVQE
ncbi:MAG: TolB family protein [Candidatus Cyclobacteriaceae bacterium M2_1C_046]